MKSRASRLEMGQELSPAAAWHHLRLCADDGKVVLDAKVVDVNEYGCGVLTAEPLRVNSKVVVKNPSFPDQDVLSERSARVTYCQRHVPGTYWVQLAFEGSAHITARQILTGRKQPRHRRKV